MMQLPVWLVEYEARRPTLTRPLTTEDHLSILVGASDRDGAAAAFRQRYGGHRIVSISLHSALGFG
jgi:hypothetical protein